MENKKNIAITGTGSLVGQAVIKSIVRSDLKDKINLIGFDYFKDTVGSFWVSQNFILPDILKPHVTHQDWLNSLLSALLANDIKMLFVGVDFELPLFAKFKDEIEQKTGAIVMVSSLDVISIADDKFLTFEFLKKHGLPCPESFLPDNIDNNKLKFPIIIKPRKGARSVGVHKIKDQTHLLSVMKTIDDPIIQEYVGTDDEEYTCGTIFLNNELKRLIVLKRSLKEGNTFISKYKKDFPKVISSYLEQVCAHLQPFGACNFQLRIDSNGVPKIFEINSRHSGTTYIRSLFGYKEVEYIVSLLLFDIELDFELKEGTVVRFYDEFFVQ